MAAAVVRTRSVELRSGADELWPYLSDTERLNRRAGLGTVELEPLDSSSSAARYVGHTKLAGWPVTYEELPFEWERPRHWHIDRRMRNGPMRSFRMSCTLGPPAAGSSGASVSFRLDIEPRWWLARPAITLVAEHVLRQFVGLAHEIDAALRDGAPYPFHEPRSACSESGLAGAREALLREGVAAERADALLAYVRGLPDLDASRIRPHRVARALEVPPRAAASLCLKAVLAGLLEIRWALLCPSCLAPSQKVPSLSELGTEGHCQLCDLRYGLSLDRAVEATFVPHPAVRQVPEVAYCSSGPARTLHVVAQAIVPPGEQRPLVVPEEPSRLRLFVRGGRAARVEVEPAGSNEARAEIEREQLVPASLDMAPSGTIHVHNDTGEPVHARLERSDWLDEATTAHDVALLPEFRDRFSAELLKPGLALGISRVTLVFTDLVGSTALYSAIGEASAFGVVSDHFDLLRAAFDAAGGAVIKTMGDAVMAAFRAPADAVEASRAALSAFGAFRETRAHAAKLGLKIGMHEGACYVVTANGVLDYFGQVVNTAARVQAQARGGELVLAQSVSEEHEVALALERMQETERFLAKLKGIEAEVPLVRYGLRAS